jgi:2-polyprenyl-3-methyl-5-hydroxy-6-metoxy-1,4-benzoquinol methylase
VVAQRRNAMLSDAEIWRDWLAWLPTAMPSEDPRRFFGQYQTFLMAKGMEESSVDQYLNTIRRFMRTSADGWQIMFNNIYTNPEAGFRTAPNSLLLTAVEGIPAGKALDVSAGQGRNAVFLAKAGWDITAVDISEVGLQIAARNAQEAGVKLHTRHQSIQQLDYGTDQWDLIVMTYAPVPLAQPDTAARTIAALRPKGIVVVETYASDEDAPARRPIDLDPAKLRSTWSSAHIKHFEDTVATSDWDRQATRLIRMVAAKRDS